MSNEEIDAVIPTISKRPQVWYDKVNELIEAGFTYTHLSAEWVNKTTGERGRIAFTETEAWLRHPSHQPA